MMVSVPAVRWPSTTGAGVNYVRGYGYHPRRLSRRTQRIEKMDDDVAELVVIGFEYMDGKLSLNEALTKLSHQFPETPVENFEKVLRKSERYNVIEIRGAGSDNEL